MSKTVVTNPSNTLKGSNHGLEPKLKLEQEKVKCRMCERRGDTVKFISIFLLFVFVFSHFEDFFFFFLHVRVGSVTRAIPY